MRQAGIRTGRNESDDILEKRYPDDSKRVWARQKTANYTYWNTYSILIEVTSLTW